MQSQYALASCVSGRVVDEFVSATRGSNSMWMVFTYSLDCLFVCLLRGCFSNCSDLFVRQPLVSIYFCVCKTVYVCVQSIYVSMVVFVFAVRAGELSWQMLIVHKHVDLKKSIQLSPLRRWRMDRIHEKAHDMMAFLVAIENPVTNIFKTSLTAKSPQIHPPSGAQHRGKLKYQ